MREESAGLFLLRDGPLADAGYSWEMRASTAGEFHAIGDFEAQGLFEVYEGNRGGEAAGLFAVYKKGCDEVAERKVRMADLCAETFLVAIYKILLRILSAGELRVRHAKSAWFSSDPYRAIVE